MKVKEGKWNCRNVSLLNNHYSTSDSSPSRSWMGHSVRTLHQLPSITLLHHLL